MKRRTAKAVVHRQEWPAIVFLRGFGLAFLSYVLARIILDGQPHPFHWLASLIGGMVGVGIGWLWFWWRGDVS